MMSTSAAEEATIQPLGLELQSLVPGNELLRSRMLQELSRRTEALRAGAT